MKRLILAVLTLIVGLTAVQYAGGQTVDSPSADGDAALHRFLAQEGPRLRAYRGTRHLRAHNARFNLTGEMEVQIDFSAARGLEYRIMRESGSSVIRRRVLRPLLEEERALWRQHEPEGAAITTANYSFGPAEPDAVPKAPDTPVLAIPLRPQRRERLLVDGVLLLTPDGDLRAVSGRLARNPSWWTSRVDILREYAHVAGVRVPIATRSVAHVKLAGRSELEMTYAYDSINGVDVSDPISRFAAAAAPADARPAASPGESAPTPR